MNKMNPQCSIYVGVECFGTCLQALNKEENCQYQRSRDSSVGIATGYGLDDQEGREFESR
jgi:hypothetical protein